MKHLLTGALTLLASTFIFSCSGSDGSDGAAGLDGLSCEVSAAEQGSGHDYRIFCGGEFAGYLDNGADGANGADGKDGKDGVDGTNGADGTQGPKGDKGDAGGSDGQSCDTAEDGAYFVMKCGGVEKARWAKAMCGTSAYDPDTHVCDMRDAAIYKWVKIGSQIWMDENLNYNASGSECYDNNSSNCNTYGRQYNWTTAMNGAASSSATPSGVQGVCPAGWHLPSDAEWVVLVRYVDPSATGYYSNVAGTKLKATSGWNSSNGTDEFGFSALPGGGYSGGGFSGADHFGGWWSTTENLASYAWFWYMFYSDENVGRNPENKSDLYSVRCVKN